MKLMIRVAGILLVVFFMVAISTASLQAQTQGSLTFGKVFQPDTIGPGSVSTLTFTITNSASNVVTNLAFSDTLPAGVSIAAPANIVSTCNGPSGMVSAPDGGTTITLSDGAVGANSSCKISVNVTSSTAGTHMNVSGDLTSSAGNSGTASADLIVATDRPGFSKSFSPASVNLGDRTTLTFSIDNTANTSLAAALGFTDNLPVGLKVAAPANADTDCLGGIITAVPDSSLISLSGALLLSGSSCSVSVDVIPTAQGLLGNISGELTSTVGVSFFSSGKASAVLDVSAGILALTKAFTDDPVLPGGTATLEFTITNFDRNESATNIAFTDDLDAALTGLVATGLPMNPCGAGSALTGTDLITLSGGTLAPGASCTFDVALQVPAMAVPGKYPNTTSSVTGDIGGIGFVGAAASDSLFVNFGPLLTKTFLNDPVGAGYTVTLEFSITNTSSDYQATNITFIDDLTAFLPFPISAVLPPVPDPPCGTGSTISLISLELGGQGLQLSNGNLAAGDSCTFSVGLNLPADLAENNYVNTTGDITATINGKTATGAPATDELTVVSAPTLRKEFTDDPVDAGGTVTLEFTLEHSDTAIGNATGITFTDDLATVMPDLAATGLPLNDLCGTGNGSLTGSAMDTLLTFSNGSLAPGETCTFSVTLQTPAAASLGSYPNTTSEVTATVAGVTAKNSPASDNLFIGGFNFTKEFIDDPVIPGDTVTLRFKLENNTDSNATDIFFTDNLNDTLSSLTAVPLLPTTPCGAGSSISGTNFLIFTGGNLVAGSSCQFDITLQVPAGAVSNSYSNITSGLFATIDGSSVSLNPATDTLTVDANLLFITKEFTDDPVVPGGTVTLEFTITNLDPGSAVTDISFTDDLGSVISGMAAATPLPTNPCGTGSTLSGTGTLSLTVGNLSPGGSCTFSVNVQVPLSALDGTEAENTTSEATGMLGGLSVTGPPATGTLLVSANPAPGFTKKFSPDSIPTRGTSTLTFTIDNTASMARTTGLSFTDNLPSGVIIAPTPNASTTCVGGTLTAVAGASLVSYTNGSVLQEKTCTVQVDVVGRAPGMHVNTSGKLTSSLGSSGTATDTLTVTGGVDFGDAPDIYKTLLANDGASHGVGSGLFLGDCIDTEADGQPNANADGDDNGNGTYVGGACTTGGDDEDGVVFNTLTASGQTAEIVVTASASCTLSAWMNFNADNDWTDMGENLFPGGEPLDAGSNTLTFNVPSGAIIGDTYARFRCASSGVLGSFGEAVDGEVEDYKVSIVTIPTVSTPVYSAVTISSATLGATVDSDNGDTVTERGVVWSTSANPTITSNTGSETAAGTTGIFTVSATGLSAYTTWHFRGYATNGAGTGYTNDAVFVTDPAAPTVTTDGVSDITLNSAKGTGNITSLGVPNPSAHGMVWSTSPDPTIANNSSDEGSATSTGVFTSTMTGLVPYTTYYARAYATNTAKTAYGQEIMFHTGPEIVVEGNSNDIGDGDVIPLESNHTDFGGADVKGGQVVRTFTIKNTGDAVLNLTGNPIVKVAGTHSGDFTATSQPMTPVAKDGFTTFQITFDPSASGVRSATVSIDNDDEDENPFTFAIQGEGLVPEIKVEGNSVEILDGDSTPSADDDTNFGPVPRDGGNVAHTFTIRNIGGAPLNLTGTPIVSVSGAQSGDFTVTSSPTTPVADGGFTTFEITFDPSASGVRSATVNIDNDDQDENPYTFAIQGFGDQDDDMDGVSYFEEAGPNGDNPGYDGNGDGIPDGTQGSVASLHTVSGDDYVTLVAEGGKQLENVAAVPNPSPGNAPDGIVFPYGFFEFTISGVGLGGSAALNIILPPGAYITTYWKYGPSPLNPAPDWYEFLQNGSTGASIFSNIITLNFVDGLLGDDILTQDGMIIDQGGPGIPSSLVPTLSEWGMGLLAFLLLLLSVRAIRGRKMGL